MDQELWDLLQKVNAILVTYKPDDPVAKELIRLFMVITIYLNNKADEASYDKICPCKKECQF